MHRARQKKTVNFRTITKEWKIAFLKGIHNLTLNSPFIKPFPSNSRFSPAPTIYCRELRVKFGSEKSNFVWESSNVTIPLNQTWYFNWNWNRQKYVSFKCENFEVSALCFLAFQVYKASFTLCVTSRCLYREYTLRSLCFSANQNCYGRLWHKKNDLQTVAICLWLQQNKV